MKIEDAIENLNDVLTVMKTQHMMKSIDGELEDGEVQMYRDRYESVHMGIRALEKQLRGELAEVVRCKNCKKYDTKTGVCYEHKIYDYEADWFEDNDYCSYGERK